MLDDIVKQLKILSNNKSDETAILNILNAKLNHLFSFKRVKFTSVNNPRKPFVLCYYAFNFLQSGGVKDKVVGEIDTHLLGFFDDVLKNYNEARFNKLELKHIKQLNQISERAEINSKKKEQEKELKSFKKLHKKIADASTSRLHEYAQMIEQENCGSVSFQHTEFVIFFKEIVINRDKMKGEFLNTLYNLYDGELAGTDTSSTERDFINDVPLTTIFLSSPKILEKSEKMSEEFRDVLEQGIARRSFVYFDKSINYYKEGVEYSTTEEKNRAIDKLENYSKIIQKIYNNIEENTVYEFSEEANKESIKWSMKMDAECAKFYTFTDTLRDEENILCINLGNSAWKITKLAVLYHILDGGVGKVKVESFKKAAEFFMKTHKCLENLLNNKVSSNYENLYNYLVKNRNKFVSTMVLRRESFVGWKDFTNWFKGAELELEELSKRNGLCVGTTYTGNRNQGFAIAIFDPNKFNYNVISDKDNRIVATLIDIEKSKPKYIDNFD